MLKNKFGKKAVAAVMAAAMTVSATAMGLSSITASAAATDVATYFHFLHRHNQQILSVKIVQYIKTPYIRFAQMCGVFT